ncbi:hypothetical protein ACFS32_16120 [Novosphingobium pokkalii]|uniref:hypothetical protein n=1 Tax=Novosphingobium pokkalii TaxID=1770194 RepID=UPI003625A2A1
MAEMIPAETLVVDTMVTGALLVTMDPQRRVIRDGAVAMAGGRSSPSAPAPSLPPR